MSVSEAIPRSNLCLAAYSNKSPDLASLNVSCTGRDLNDADSSFFLSYDLAPCLILTVVHALIHMFLLVTYMLTDLLKAKGPFLRLWIGVNLAMEMQHEINARSGDVLFPQEQRAPTASVFDRLLGSTTQTFILNLDRSVLALMIGGFMSTVLRPESCAFIVLPCRDSNALFFYRQDRRTRRLLGTRRYERLMLYLRLRRNQLRKQIKRLCFPRGRRSGASNATRTWDSSATDSERQTSAAYAPADV